MRKPASSRRRKPRVAKLKSFPAPIGGWVANTNLATPGARLPDGTKVNGAAVLENWFPTATGIRMRGGSQRHAVIGTDGAPVTALFSYVYGSTQKMFAANASAIYDVTSPAYAEDLFLLDDDGNFLVDDDGNFVVFPGTPEAAVADTAGGNWSVVQFATSGGVYLRLVNGEDTSLVYDGSTFAESPAITGVSSALLSNVWAHKNRIFYVQKESLDAWYHDVGAIGGGVTKFPLGGVFTRGGSLLCGESWSLDADGLSAQCIFVTTEGEVAVYQGSNPGVADDWRLVGVYRIGRPRGPKALIRAGGDLVIATDVGFIPLSQAIQRDYAALSPGAISYPIEDAWNAAVRDRTTLTWQCVVWPTKQMAIVVLPPSTGNQDSMFVANVRTGRWAKYTGWGGTCALVFGERLFFGTRDGRILEGEVTGADQAAAYTATCVPLFDPLESPASLKNGLQARVVLRANANVNARLSLQKNYEVRLPAAPDDTAVIGGSLWGEAIWGTATWGGESELRTRQEWRSVPGEGYALSVATQITSGQTAKPNVELVQTDLTYEQADIAT